MKFSIIVVSLNPGDKLRKTIESVQAQTFQDYEILIKDGGSGDGSVKPYLEASESPKLRVCVRPDKSIYDAMNQAVKLAAGEYFLFLNCGDYLYDSEVLRKAAEKIDGEFPAIYYGDLYQRNLNTQINSCREITPFTCYRNIPCHQTCFYHRSLFEERGYDLSYPVRADYEHFLYCYFTRKAKTVYMPLLVSSYEGAGFSETREHLRDAKAEHRKITGKYLTNAQRFGYRAVMILTLQPLRTFIANNKTLSKYYNRLKTFLYRK